LGENVHNRKKDEKFKFCMGSIVGIIVHKIRGFIGLQALLDSRVFFIDRTYENAF